MSGGERDPWDTDWAREQPPGPGVGPPTPAPTPAATPGAAPAPAPASVPAAAPAPAPAATPGAAPRRPAARSAAPSFDDFEPDTRNIPPAAARTNWPSPRNRSGLPDALLLLAMLPAAVAALSVAGAALLGAAPAWVAWTGAALLLILPFFGLLFVLGPRRWAAVLAAWGWSALLLAATPYWVPGARGPALAAGLRAVSAPLGAGVVPDADALAAWIGRLVDRLLPPPGGGTAPTEAATGSSHRPAAGPRPRVDRELPAEPAVAPASLSSAAASGSIVLSAEEEGRTLRVPVTFAGPRGPLELSMMFDTGATVTTLDSKTLARLGVPVATDAPQVTLQTAGGEKKARLVLVDSVQLGDARIRHVSVAVCESCAQGKASGLLGLNVTGLFDVTLRQEEREFVLSPRDGGIDRQLDVSHWLDISSTARQWPGGRVEVEVAAANRAVVPVAEAVIEVECREASFAVQLDDVPARGRQQSKVQLPDGTDCGSYRIVLRSARW